MSAINFVVIGYGGMGAYHVHNILPNENERIHIVGTYDIRKKDKLFHKKKGIKSIKVMKKS